MRRTLRLLGRLLLILAAVAAVVLLVLAAASRPAAPYPFFESDRPMVIAHQGGEGLRPSNTLASFSHAVELGVDVLEMDVHSTKDGVLVVIHDDTVDRTTNGAGRVQDLTLAEIQALDAGDYWTPDDGQTYPYRGQGIRIPALEEVFRAFPQMKYNIEIKQREPSIAADLCDLLRRYNLSDRTLVASFHGQSIEEFRAACPEVATSMVESEIRLFYVLSRVGLGRLFSPPGTAFQVPEYSGGIHILTAPFIDGAHGRGVAVHPWTIDEADDMRRLLDLGVDGIITDRPDVMLDVLSAP